MLKAEYIVYLCVYINISCIFSVFLFLIIYLLVSYSSSLFSGPLGSKPPPLNMMSPANAKQARNTATVSPLHHVTSPTNGVNSLGSNAALNASRTSSFAAALRKLANQAKDPAGMYMITCIHNCLDSTKTLIKIIYKYWITTRKNNTWILSSNYSYLFVSLRYCR